MIGILLVAHLNLASEVVKVLELIIGRCEGIKAVDIFPDEDVEHIRKRIELAIKEVDKGDGVLIITDMFGGTPSNISLSYLEEGKREVICGFTLPMLIKLVTDEKKDLKEAASFIKEYGRKSIYLATELLSKDEGR